MSTETPDFDLAFVPAHGTAVPVAPGVQRITAGNSGPFTFHGTNSYIVGDRSVAVIDPGRRMRRISRRCWRPLRGAR